MVEKWNSMSNEELCLEYQQTNNNDLYEYFLKRNKNLIWYFTKSVLRKHSSQEDLIEQVGRQAMWEAMLKYDESRNAKFSTMYYFYVLKNLRDFYGEIADIKLPTYVLENLNNFKELHKDDNFVYNTISLSTEINKDENEGNALEDVLAGDIDIEEDVNNKMLREDLLKNINRLSPREVYIVASYFGIEDGIPKTLQMLGNEFDLSRERIRQIIKKALIKLRKYYKKTGDPRIIK